MWTEAVLDIVLKLIFRSFSSWPNEIPERFPLWKFEQNQLEQQVQHILEVFLFIQWFTTAML